MRLPGKLSGWVLAGLCLLSMVLMLLGERSRWLCRRARPVLVPLSHLGMVATFHLRGRVEWLPGRSPPGQDPRMEALRQDALKKQAVIDDLNRQLAEMRQWRSLFRRPLADPGRPGSPPVAYKCKLIDGDVIGAEALPLRDRKLLGVGGRAGLRAGDWATTRRTLHEFPKALPEGLTVLGRNYVVGRVIDSAAYSATLRLVTDSAFQTAGRILRLVKPGQDRPIYVRKGDGSVVRERIAHSGKTPGDEVVGEPIAVRADGAGRKVVCGHVPARHDVRAGDVLTTAWSAGLPFRLTIGRVEEVRLEKDHPHYVTVVVKPLADLRNLRRVYVVLPVGGRQN